MDTLKQNEQINIRQLISSLRIQRQNIVETWVCIIWLKIFFFFISFEKMNYFKSNNINLSFTLCFSVTCLEKH
jgi:hypothetical protein